MSKPPAFQFYASDFLTDYKVAVMSMEARGVYITLLAHAWLEIGLPEDARMLARICGNPPDWEVIWAEVRKCFLIGEDGKLYNERMELERSQLKTYIESRKKAGKAGAQARWGVTSANADVATKEPMAMRKQSSSHSSSTSISSSKEKTSDELQFDKFWKVIPYKVDKKRALKAFNNAVKIVSVDVIIKSYLKQLKANSAEWCKEGGKYCPHPSTWLNGERWTDEVTDSKKNGVPVGVAQDIFTCPLCDNKVEKDRKTWTFCENKHKRIRMLPEDELAMKHVQEYIKDMKEEEANG